MLEDYIKQTVSEAIADSMAQLRKEQQVGETAPKPNRLLRKADVAAMLGVSPRTVDRMVAMGKLSPGKAIAGGPVRATRRWSYDDIARYIHA